MRRLRRVNLQPKWYKITGVLCRNFLAGLILLNSLFFASIAQTNPPIVHDPVLIKQENIYYLFCTGKGISYYTSPDMVKWKFEGPVFDSVPAWAFKAVPGFNGHIWAPDISFINGTFYLFYSVSSFAKNGSCIGLATNKTLDKNNPDYMWLDQGIVIQSVPGRDQWNAIDPNLIQDQNGTPWLVFGSFWEGIKLVKLNADCSSPAEPQEWYTLARRQRDFSFEDKDPGNAAIEAPFIFKKDSFYYLFVSFDYCCRGMKSDYKIMAGRSNSVTGPYLDKNGKDMFMGGGSLILEGNSEWPGLGHNALFSSQGIDYLIFHAYDASDEGRPKLMIRQITWDNDGWPLLTDKL